MDLNLKVEAVFIVLEGQFVLHAADKYKIITQPHENQHHKSHTKSARQDQHELAVQGVTGCCRLIFSTSLCSF